jgi:ankyrin repeat protein
LGFGICPSFNGHSLSRVPNATIRNCCCQVIRTLVVELGADPNAATAGGRTAMHFAAATNQADAIRVLVRPYMSPSEHSASPSELLASPSELTQRALSVNQRAHQASSQRHPASS